MHWELAKPSERELADEDGSPTLRALTGVDNPVKIDVEGLVDQWIQQNLREGKSVDRNSFSLKSAVSLVMSPNHIVELVNNSLSKDQVIGGSITYISDEELQTLWRSNMYKAMGKPMERYDPKEAVMLLEDEDIVDLMGSETIEETSFEIADEAIISEQVCMYVHSSTVP